VSLDAALLLLFGLVYISGTIYLANQADIRGEYSPAIRLMLYGLVGLMGIVGFTMLQVAFFRSDDPTFVNVNTTAAFVTFVIALLAAGFSYLVLSGNSRMIHLVQRISGPQGLYNPTSVVHNTALTLMLTLLVIITGTFILGGGLSGFAQDIETSGISPIEPMFGAVVQVAAAFLGVGLGIRRTITESLGRLGLHAPTLEDFSRGISGGILLYGVTLVFSTIWVQLVPSEQISQQTQASEQLALAFDTIPLAVIASMSAALGEEVLIRGALQPVFGLFLTSIFFTLLHTQYFITPGLFLILAISLGLGWLRQRYRTTTAIVAHFVYNFIQLALLVVLTSQGGG
jgi:membrane protease YdiL (CAAX protease family)